MKEFGPDWPGWQFKVKPELLEERITDPLGGIALLETGVDAGPLFSSMERSIDGVIGQGESEANRYWSYWEHRGLNGGIVSRGNLTRDFRAPVQTAHELYASCADILRLAQGYLQPPENKWDRASKAWITMIASRRTQLKENHTDFNLVTIWLGATRPALRVYANGEWVAVDDVPAGHVLLWRGESGYRSRAEELNAIRHSAIYRSKKRRIIGLV